MRLLVTREQGNAGEGETGGFHSTHWSVVASAAADSKPALEELCCKYWTPLYWHVRRMGYGTTDAQDLTQAFFARLIEKQVLALADAGRGRFRTFLLTALNRFVINEWKSSRAEKRGGQNSHVSLSFEVAERSIRLEPFHDLTPEKLFQRRWATVVLENSLRRLGVEQAESGKSELFEKLTPGLGKSDDAPSYREVGQQFGMSSDAVKMAMSRLRRRLGEIIREEVGETVLCENELNDELRDLFTALT